MPQLNKDLRVRRSQKLIQEALIDLIEERGFDALSVREITERAMVSRATFYRLYLDKFDLVEKIFSDAIQVLFDAIAELGSEHPPLIWVRFFDHISEYARLYRALLGRKGSPWFVLKMRSSLTELVKEYEKSPHLQVMAQTRSPLLSEYVRDMIATMMVETITWWLEKDRPYSSKEMAWRCATLAYSIFNETSTWQINTIQ
ncbi:TetR/AcrR family transcriptional regulator [bacterium]|nr:TetR/AcrR family transcriptional regulator [bacterium]